METMITISDVAEKTKLSEATIRKLVFNNTIPFHKVGAAIRFYESEIEAWIITRDKKK